MSRITRRGPGIVSAVLVGLLITAASASASAQASSEEAQGAQLLQSVQNGQKTCGALTSAELELIGEAWMGQSLGSSQAHKAMNRLMSSMMGSAGEEQMHQYMGRRASGCGGGAVPAGFAGMMRTMGMMGGAPGSPGGMMGGASGGYYGPGSMMGGSPRASDNGDDGPSAGAMIGMMAVLIGAVAVALAIFRPWRHSSGGSLDVLDRRFAAGEIGADEYRRAKSLLEGGSK